MAGAGVDEGARLQAVVRLRLAGQPGVVERARGLESKLIPPGIDYASINGLRTEARQKLARITPANLGQASRISGVTPADIALLAVWMERSSQ